MPDEDTAATICLLVQAFQATADLIADSVHNGWSIADTLRLDPPVRHTRRVRDGEVVAVDLSTEPFGAGPHACPGREHALAIAGSVVQACSADRMDQVVRDTLAAIERRDQDALRRVLHPYLHWSDPHATLRGRTKVLRHLEAHPDPGPPRDYELRDGQIYRWQG